ncbi:hypothetical protein [Sulfurimonas sp.]|uniref:hypothetical protein n=1 Tax=Sulfurimonas sp. TaxID=2022749 RepID=UPI00356572F1
MIAIISLLPIFGFAALFYINFKKNISVSIFLSITFIITVLFLFGMINFLKYGAYLLFYGGIGLLLLFSVKHKEKMFGALKSVPFAIYVLSSIAYLYLMKDSQLFFWDEYSHWGAFIKEMSYFNAFYDASSVAAHINYPPGISTWEYFIVLPTGFTEGKLYFAYFLILFSSTLMMYERLNFKQIHWIVLIFASQMILFADFGHWFSSIYVDHVVGAMFAGIVLSYISDKFTFKEFLLFIFPLVSILLVKEIGLYFGIASIGMMFILEILKVKQRDEKSLLSTIKEKKELVFIFIAILVSLLFILKVWGIRLDSHGISKEGQTISGIAKSLLSDEKVLDSKVEKEVKERFWTVVKYQQLHKEQISLNYNEFSYGLMPKYKQELKLSTIGIFFFFVLMSLLAYCITENKNKKRDLSVISSYMLLITIIYLFILYFSFLVAFGNGALRIPSFVRYMNMSILPLLLIGFSLYLPVFQGTESFAKKFTNNKIFLSGLGVILILTFITEPYFKPLYSQFTNSFRLQIDKATENILKEIPEKSTIFVIFPVKNNGSLNNILKYSLIPAKATISDSSFSSKTSDEMMNTFLKYDYIWFASLNQELLNKNRSFFKAESNTNIYTLYKIEKKNDSVSINPIK